MFKQIEGFEAAQVEQPKRSALKLLSSKELLNGHYQDDAEDEQVELREGPEHQVLHLPPPRPRPRGPCTDPRAGVPGPPEQVALESAAGAEKQVADALPADAIQVCTVVLLPFDLTVLFQTGSFHGEKRAPPEPRACIATVIKYCALYQRMLPI